MSAPDTLTLEEYSRLYLTPAVDALEARQRVEAYRGYRRSLEALSLFSDHEARALGHPSHDPFPARALSREPWTIAALVPPSEENDKGIGSTPPRSKFPLPQNRTKMRGYNRG